MTFRLVAASPVGLRAVAYFFGALPVDSLAAAGGAVWVGEVPPVVEVVAPAGPA